jgi:CRP-like cAMP-binding protein
VNLNYFLRVNRQFAELEPGDLAALERELAVERYPDGHLFMREGEPGDAMYLILTGQVLVTRATQPGGQDCIIAMLGPGDMFGLIALIDDGPRCANCTAVGEVTAARLTARQFRTLFAADAPLAHHFQYLIARQLASDLRLHNAALADALAAPQDPSRAYAILGDASYEFRFPTPRGTNAPRAGDNR